jgi:[protein-PII] uridylyltransferase
VDAGVRGMDPVVSLLGELDALAKAYSPGHHGRWAARRRAELVDDCLVELWRRARAPDRMALVALGGYGRRLQMPCSDVDLLLLHNEADPAEVSSVANAVLYPLWDGGVTVGHAVRTPVEAVEAAEGRLDVLTAMLDARFLIGDRQLAARAVASVRALGSDDPARFAASVREAAEARAARFGSSARLLEPDLKEGTGGLRDVASLRWLEATYGRSLEEAGLLSRRERGDVDAAEEFLVRARSSLHLETGRRTDRLVQELQPDVARAMGFTDQPRLVPADGLMRTLFEHARNVESVVGLVLDRVADPPDRRASDPSGRSGSPSFDPLVASFDRLADLARGGGVPPPALLETISTGATAEPLVWTPEARDAFLRLLRAGPRASRMLDLLDRAHALGRLLPCWLGVRCRPQRDPYHRTTVDAHLLDTFANVARMIASAQKTADETSDPADELERTSVERIDHPEALLLGALLHDVGKVGEGNHVSVGARVAADQLEAMGIDRETRELAVFFVAEHLILPDTASRRDLTDEDLILDVAARIATRERLGALYLLAKADAEATGPAAWTAWRQTLVRELVAKVDRVLDRGAMGRELAAELAARIDGVRELLSGEADADVDRFVLRMPRGYFLAVEPQGAARHFRTIAPPLGANELRTASTSGARAGTYEVLVVAADRPGLLSWIAGALALGGISILSAQVFTTGDGVAVDLFEVEGAFDPDITETRWREFRTSLRRAMDGSISLERRVAEKRRRYPPPKVSTPVTVGVDNIASDFSTVIEVGAPDRIGLLHDITRTFADLTIDVHVAKVATFDGRVVDAFYVRDALGRKIEDTTQLSEVERALHDLLDSDLDR